MLSLTGMEFYAFHGCSAEEKKIGITFEVDIHIDYDITKPSESDNIKDAIDYQTVYQLIKEEMKITSNLIENVAYRIKVVLMKRFPVADNITVKVTKINPYPLGGNVKKVSVVA